MKEGEKYQRRGIKSELYTRLARLVLASLPTPKTLGYPCSNSVVLSDNEIDEVLPISSMILLFRSIFNF